MGFRGGVGGAAQETGPMIIIGPKKNSVKVGVIGYGLMLSWRTDEEKTKSDTCGVAGRLGTTPGSVGTVPGLDFNGTGAEEERGETAHLALTKGGPRTCPMDCDSGGGKRGVPTQKKEKKWCRRGSKFALTRPA